MKHDPCLGSFETSGLGGAGYPIEVGWSTSDGTTLAVIIRPEPDWLFGDTKVEGSHHIGRADLVRYGRPPRRIAEAMNRDLDGQILYMDDGLHDRFCLERLYEAAGLEPSFVFGRFRDLLASIGCGTWGRRRAVEQRMGDNFLRFGAANNGVRRLFSIYRDARDIHQNSQQ